MKNKFKKLITLIIFGLSLFGAQGVDAKCNPPSGWPYNEVQNFSNNSVETVFMGKLMSKKETRQGQGYKYYELVFDVKRSGFQKGQYPEDGRIKVYTPVSEELCGYYDKDFFAIGSYMIMYAKKNNGLNITDKYSLNRSYTDEVIASRDLQAIVRSSNKKTVVTEVSSDNNFLNKLLMYILFSGLLLLTAYYFIARRHHLGKMKDDENFFEDDKNMYFTTKNDEIEIRVRKNNNL